MNINDTVESICALHETPRMSHEDVERAIVATFNDMGLVFGSRKQGEAWFKAFREAMLRYYEEKYLTLKP